MFKHRLIPYAVLTAGLLVAGGASAQSMSSIDAREAYQQDRIQDGRRDGALTRGETARLEQGQARIDRYQARAESNGVVSPGERQHLDGMLDRQGRAISRDEHNNQRADGGRAGWNDGGNGWDRGRDGWDHREGMNRDRDGGRNGWDRGRDDHREGMNRDRDGWNRGGDRGRDGWDHREGMNRDNDGHHNGWDRAGGQPGFGGQSHQPGMQNAGGQYGGHQYGGGQYGQPANGGYQQPHMQNISGQPGQPNYGGFRQGGTQQGGTQYGQPNHGTATSQYTRAGSYTPNQGAAVSQYARTNTSMPPVAADPRQAAPVRTVSAGGGGRSFSGGTHR